MVVMKMLAAVSIAALLVTTLPEPVVAADPCHTAILKSLAKYKKAYLKFHAKCLNKENKGAIPGPCPDAITNLAIQKANVKAVDKISSTCTLAQIQGLGFRSDCAYEAATQGREGQCAALPVTTPAEFAECMKCWKGAELSEFLAILYASKANEVCGGDLGETSPVCSDLDCTSPLPVQRELGDTGENDCQIGISKAGTKYLVKREKIIERCLLRGCDRAECLAGTCAADLTVAVKLDKAEAQKHAIIKKKCGNRDPSPGEPPFCCRCGQGNQCMDAPDIATCESMAGCSVQEGKVCNLGNLTCDPGPKTITWWNNCPESAACPGAAVTTIDQLIDCVDTAADTIVDELICFQYPGYPCPPDDDPPSTTTTTTTTIP